MYVACGSYSHLLDLMGRIWPRFLCCLVIWPLSSNTHLTCLSFKLVFWDILVFLPPSHLFLTQTHLPSSLLNFVAARMALWTCSFLNVHLQFDLSITQEHKKPEFSSCSATDLYGLIFMGVHLIKHRYLHPQQVLSTPFPIQRDKSDLLGHNSFHPAGDWNFLKTGRWIVS